MRIAHLPQIRPYHCLWTPATASPYIPVAFHPHDIVHSPPLTLTVDGTRACLRAAQPLSSGLRTATALPLAGGLRRMSTMRLEPSQSDSLLDIGTPGANIPYPAIGPLSATDPSFLPAKAENGAVSPSNGDRGSWCRLGAHTRARSVPAAWDPAPP